LNLKPITFLMISMVLFFSTVLSGCFLFENPYQPQPTPSTNPSPTPSPSVSPNAINFTLPNIDGGMTSLSDYRGQPVLVVFFSYTCSHCRDEAATLEGVYNKYKESKGLIILGVGVDSNPGQLSQFRSQYDWTFPVLNDSNRMVYKQFFTAGVPALLFINRTGELAKKRLGALTATELDQWLQAYIL